jgi:hypothetical protein
VDDFLTAAFKENENQHQIIGPSFKQMGLKTKKDVDLFLRNVSPECHEFLGWCHWGGEQVRCSELFEMVRSDRVLYKSNHKLAQLQKKYFPQSQQVTAPAIATTPETIMHEIVF